MLPVLLLNGVLHLDVVENAVTSADFCCFVEGLLPCMNKFSLPNSVLVIDNASIHRFDGIWEIVEDCATHLVYLSLYSPDFMSRSSPHKTYCMVMRQRRSWAWPVW